jgi:hypothetical protein
VPSLLRIAAATALATAVACAGTESPEQVSISTSAPVTLVAGGEVDIDVNVTCDPIAVVSISWADDQNAFREAPFIDGGVLVPGFGSIPTITCADPSGVGFGSGTETMRLYAADDAALGLHHLTLKASVEGDRDFVTVDVNVVAPVGPAFSFTAPAQVVPDSTYRVTLSLSVRRTGYDGSIELTWQPTGLPFGGGSSGFGSPVPADAIPAGESNVSRDFIFFSITQGIPYVLIRASGGGTERAALVRILASSNLPGTPAGFSAIPAVNSIALAWNTAATILSYRLERETAPGTWALLADLPGSTGTYDDGGRTPDTPYSYRLSATNVNGTSPFATLTTRTLPTPPPPPPPPGQGWVQLGAAASVGVVEPQPSLLIDPENRPVVAYREGVGSDPQRVYVKRFEGGVWVQVGSASVSSGASDAQQPSLAIDGTGALYVAWQQNEPGLQNRIYVSRFNGSAWESVVPGGLPVDVAGAPSAQPSLAIGTGDVPIVAWRQGGTVQVRTLQGGQWVLTNGTGVISAPGAYDLHMTADGSAIAWAEGAGPTSAVKVVRGFDFGALGSSATPLPLGASVSGFGIVNTLGEPYVVYAEGLSPFSIRTRRWDGTAWVDFGIPIINQGDGTLASIAMDSRQRVVAYSYSCAGGGCSSLGVYGFTQTGWSPLTSFLTLVESQVSRGISVAMATTTSPVVAAGVQVGSSWELRVRRYYPF